MKCFSKIVVGLITVLGATDVLAAAPAAAAQPSLQKYFKHGADAHRYFNALLFYDFSPTAKTTIGTAQIA